MCYAIVRVRFVGNDPKQTIDVENNDDLESVLVRVREMPNATGYRVYRIDEVHERVPTWTHIE